MLEACKKVLAAAAKMHKATPTDQVVLPLPSDISERVAAAIYLYGVMLEEDSKKFDEQLLQEIKDLLAKESAAKEAEELRCKELEVCKKDIRAAKHTLLEHLGSYLATVKK